MRPPTFYFAIGDRPRPRDLTIALAVGQRHFLVPFTSTILALLRDEPGVSVVVDSRAWPPDDPSRPSLEEYVRHLLTWRRLGGWGNLAWAAAYDHLRDPHRSQHDYARLLALLDEHDAADCPIVPVRHYDVAHGATAAAKSILHNFTHDLAGTRADLIDEGADLDRPGYAIGALVPVLRPTCPAEERDAAAEWLRNLADALEQESMRDEEEDYVDLELLRLHVFGIGQPDILRASPLITSFDSSGPARLAAFGWKKIAPTFNPTYGLSAEKLQRSRETRLAYWLIRYRDAVGLPWRKVAEAELFDNRHQPAAIQHGLALAFA